MDGPPSVVLVDVDNMIGVHYIAFYFGKHFRIPFLGAILLAIIALQIARCRARGEHRVLYELSLHLNFLGTV